MTKVAITNKPVHQRSGPGAPFFFLYLLVMLIANTAGAQKKVKFQHLTNTDGLSQSTVQAILKDRLGFIWFGTQDGLNRYDGYEFKVYRHKPKDTTSLRRSHITKLLEDRQGNLWVGTATGALSLYDRKRDAFIHFKENMDSNDGLSQKTVTALYEDRQGNLWVGTYWKLNLLDRKTGKFTHFAHDPANPRSISGDGITAILEDNRGNLWIGTSDGLNIMDRKTRTFRHYFAGNDSRSLSDNKIRSIHQDARGRLWIGTSNGLNLYDYTTGRFTRFVNDPANPKSLIHNEVSSIIDAGDGKLWLGTPDALELFDPASGTCAHFSSNPLNPNTLSKNGNITALYKDPQGMLWVGTYQGGVNKYDPHLTFFETHRNNTDNNQSLSFNIVTSFAEAPNGDVWVGTGGGGINRWNRQTNTFERFNPEPGNPASLTNFGVLSLNQGKKYLWVGMYDGGVNRFDPATRRFHHITEGDRPDQLNNDDVYALYEDSKGMVWIGTNGGGVNVLNPETGIITKYRSEQDNPNSVIGNYIRCFFEDREGRVWIGSSNGISLYNQHTRKFDQCLQVNNILESDVILSLYGDQKGNLWIGTLGGGLNKMDTRTGKITMFTTDDGLPDNSINSIVEDSYGILWLSTNYGLAKFDPVIGSFKTLGLDHGIQSYEYSQDAGIRTSNGTILFGGINGFNVIDPDQLIYNRNIPPVVITGFRLFNRPVVPGEKGSPLQEDILQTREITLNPNQYIITLEFAALGYTAPQKNQYAIKLEGFDDDWVYIGQERKATYTHLSPGTYIFRVKAANNDGVWNEQGAAIKIVVLPPFWQTWWFRTLAVLAIALAIVLTYKKRTGLIRAQQLMLEREVRERTQSLAVMTMEERKARKEAVDANRELERKNKELEQFAYVASHDMQEPLRTISSFVGLLQYQYQGKLDEKSDKYISFIVQAADRMKVLINDLLDYSRIGSKKELSTVDCNQVVQEVLADLQLAIRESGAEITTGTLPVVQAYPTEMKQLFQNLITNAIKFRKKEEHPRIHVSAELIDNHWQFVVTDNGIGIDPKHHDRIFAIFQRLHTRSEYQGSGIGLSNCRKIAELHGGRIWVESEPGAGSAFHFTVHEQETAEQEAETA